MLFSIMLLECSTSYTDVTLWLLGYKSLLNAIWHTPNCDFCLALYHKDLTDGELSTMVLSCLISEALSIY